MRVFAVSVAVILVLVILALGLLMASMYSDFVQQQPLAAQYSRLKATTDATLMENTQLRNEKLALEEMNALLQAENAELREQLANTD